MRVEERGNGTLTSLESGKLLPADVVFYSAGRQGAVADLDLANAGLEADERGRISVDERSGPRCRTSTRSATSSASRISRPRQPSRAGSPRATSSGSSTSGAEALLPIGIYSIPEISFVGKTETELTEAMTPYEVGIAHYRELARGQILGESHGLVKLLVSPDDRKLLGVHAFGAGATEVVHIGQAVMGLGGTIDYLVDAVFNYPTFAEAYKVAALDALNKLRAISAV